MPTAITQFDEIYAVGDSMSDSGGIYGLSSEAIELAEKALNVTSLPGLEPIPISPPYAERFSNGPVLPEITADLLGADLVNFSFGGAEALGHQTLLQAAPPEISAATRRYSALCRRSKPRRFWTCSITTSIFPGSLTSSPRPRPIPSSNSARERDRAQ